MLNAATTTTTATLKMTEDLQEYTDIWNYFLHKGWKFMAQV